MSMMPTAQDIASWPPPNFVNPETRRPLVLAIEIPLMVLVITFVTCRLYSRAVIVKAIGMDDWIMLLAALLQLGQGIMLCISTLPSYRTGYHMWDLPLEYISHPVKTAQIAMAAQLIFIFICALTKISVLSTYLRIFPSLNSIRFSRSLIAFEVVWCLGSLLAVLFQCTPVQAYWLTAEYPDRKCIPLGPLLYTTGCLNVLTDFLVFLWPAKDLSAIKVSLRQRLTLIAMFCLGILTCVAGICRLWYTSVYLRSYDELYNGATLHTIVAVETSVGILCGSLPSCKPFLTITFLRFFPSTNASEQPRTKPSRFQGQSFPFQSLSGGIVKEDNYRVEYEDSGSRPYGKTTRITAHPNNIDRNDAISIGSEEWIIMREDPKSNIVLPPINFGRNVGLPT